MIVRRRFISSTRLRWDLEHDLTTLLQLDLASWVLASHSTYILMADVGCIRLSLTKRERYLWGAKAKERESAPMAKRKSLE